MSTPSVIDIIEAEFLRRGFDCSSNRAAIEATIEILAENISATMIDEAITGPDTKSPQAHDEAYGDWVQRMRRIAIRNAIRGALK